MITYTHPLADIFPIKTLIAKQLPTMNSIIDLMCIENAGKVDVVYG